MQKHRLILRVIVRAHHVGSDALGPLLAAAGVTPSSEDIFFGTSWDSVHLEAYSSSLPVFLINFRPAFLAVFAFPVVLCDRFVLFWSLRSAAKEVRLWEL